MDGPLIIRGHKIFLKCACVNVFLYKLTKKTIAPIKTAFKKVVINMKCYWIIIFKNQNFAWFYWFNNEWKDKFAKFVLKIYVEYIKVYTINKRLSHQDFSATILTVALLSFTQVIKGSLCNSNIRSPFTLTPIFPEDLCIIATQNWYQYQRFTTSFGLNKKYMKLYTSRIRI